VGEIPGSYHQASEQKHNRKTGSHTKDITVLKDKEIRNCTTGRKATSLVTMKGMSKLGTDYTI